MAAALGLARRLQSEVRTATLALGGEPVGASVGSAQWTPGTGAETLARADRALLDAKRAGGGIASPAATTRPRSSADDVSARRRDPAGGEGRCAR